MGHKAFTVMALHSGGRGHGGGGVCLSCETAGSVDTALDPSGQLSSSFQSGDTHEAREREAVVIPRSMLQTIPERGCCYSLPIPIKPYGFCACLAPYLLTYYSMGCHRLVIPIVIPIVLCFVMGYVLQFGETAYKST